MDLSCDPSDPKQWHKTGLRCSVCKNQINQCGGMYFSSDCSCPSALAEPDEPNTILEIERNSPD